MAKKVSTCIFTFLLIFGLLQATANATEGYWKFRRELVPPSPVNPNEKYAKLVIPMEVLGRSQQTLSDLRIVNAEGKEIPYIRLESLVQRKQPYPAQIFNAGQLELGKRMVSVVSVDTGVGIRMHNGVNIELSGQDFIATVKVEGSDDQKTWVQLTTGAILDMPYRYTSVNYHQVNYRYLRLFLENKKGNVGEIRAVSISPVDIVEIERPLFSKEAIEFTAKPTLSKNRDAMIWETSTPYPVNVAAITFDIASDYFERRVEVKVSDDGKQWFTTGGGYIFRYPDGGMTLQLQLPVEKGRYWQVWLYHDNDKPLAVSKVEMHAPFEEIVFPYSSEKIYLRYDNTTAETPHYDLVNIISHNPGALNSLQEWKIGEPQALNAPQNAKKNKPWTENNKYLLNIALIFMVGVLGYFLKRAYS